jgi:hypothetical protein
MSRNEASAVSCLLRRSRISSVTDVGSGPLQPPTPKKATVISDCDPPAGLRLLISLGGKPRSNDARNRTGSSAAARGDEDLGARRCRRRTA